MIAVVGLAFRLPGADHPGQFWHNIRHGVNSVRRFSSAELDAAGVKRTPGLVAVSGTLDGVADFDAGFFGMSPAEAARTDPQHRLFLETCYQALADGGYASSPGTRIGVVAGASYHLYPLHNYLLNNVLPAGGPDDTVSTLQSAIGNHPDFVATRVAYRLGLTGPAFSVLSGCSTSAMAVHLASQSLLTGESDLMLAGAASVHIPQVTGYTYVKGSILSKTGVCRPFDAAADGTVGGNGVAAVLLKRLDRALADGDRIHAVIRGVGVVNDGADKRAYAAPSAAGQTRALLRGLEVAGVDAGDIGYLETHGTGTLKGDPIEFDAAVAAYREHTGRVAYCALGSTKANIGHLDSCSGMASLIKAILVLQRAEIPPLANFTRPNPALALDGSPFRIPLAAEPWAGTGPRLAGLTSLGVGGTNVHLVLEQAPVLARPRRSRAAGVLPVSAHTPAALTELTSALAARLGVTDDVADLVWSVAVGQGQHRYRVAATGSTAAELAASLADATAVEAGEPPRIGLVVPAGTTAETCAQWTKLGIEPAAVAGEFMALGMAGALPMAAAGQLAALRTSLDAERTDTDGMLVPLGDRPSLPAFRAAFDAAPWQPARIPVLWGTGLRAAGWTPSWADWPAPPAPGGGLAAAGYETFTVRPLTGPELERTAAELWSRGAAVDWAAVLAGTGGTRTDIPPYPFQRRRHWLAPEHKETPMQVQVLDRIRELTGRHLGCPVSEVGPDTAFTSLGADSLVMVNMVRDLEREFAVKVSMRELFEEADSPRGLATLIETRMAGLPEAGAGEPSAALAARVVVPAQRVPGSADRTALRSEAPSVPAVPVPVVAVPAVPEPQVAAPQAATPPVFVPKTSALPVSAPLASGGPVTRAEIEALAEEIRQVTGRQLSLMAEMSGLVARFAAGEGR
ncbi:beta-ketoacyl synthase N-terminal-like domain-containing protein [Longispora albida]|uniref:beta-ketoacyl synthase N-terminal-like domain-containing protein n=1 Tax=Longispora albida TaxID=203523 RepID=UPI001B7FED4B|nr:type I polyketide synthase [Longispora albida]